MNYYALLVALILITALFMDGTRQGNKKYIIVASLLLFCVFGLRNTFYIGNDTTGSYLMGFQRRGAASWGTVFSGNSFNKGYFVIEKVFYELYHGDYQLFISTIAVFVTICFGRLIYKYSTNPLQSILYHFGLLFFTFHFSALKQSIAMSILLLAFDDLIERKPVRFFIAVLLAGQFHFPSMIFLAAYPVSFLKPGRSYVIVLAILLVMTYLLRNQIITLMLSVYSNEELSYVNLDSVRFLRTKVLIMIVIVVAAIVLRKPRAEDRLYGILLEFMGFAVIFQTFCGYNNIFERLADYFFQFSVLFIPMIFDKNAEREPLFGWRIMSLIDTIGPYLFCSFGIYRFLAYVTDNILYYPFKFFWQ